MQGLFIEYVFLILIILALVMLANKLRLAYPIVLVLGGLAVSFAGRFSNITIDPELVFFIFLPPLLYEAAWQVSWKEFWKWRRVIVGFAFPIGIINASVKFFPVSDRNRSYFNLSAFRFRRAPFRILTNYDASRQY